MNSSTFSSASDSNHIATLWDNRLFADRQVVSSDKCRERITFRFSNGLNDSQVLRLGEINGSSTSARIWCCGWCSAVRSIINRSTFRSSNGKSSIIIGDGWSIDRQCVFEIPSGFISRWVIESNHTLVQVCPRTIVSREITITWSRIEIHITRCNIHWVDINGIIYTTTTDSKLCVIPWGGCAFKVHWLTMFCLFIRWLINYILTSLSMNNIIIAIACRNNNPDRILVTISLIGSKKRLFWVAIVIPCIITATWFIAILIMKISISSVSNMWILSWNQIPVRVNIGTMVGLVGNIIHSRIVRLSPHIPSSYYEKQEHWYGEP